MTIIQGHRPGTETPARTRVSALRAPDETDPNWRDHAACRDAADKELWFPIGNTGPALLQIEDAKAWCRRCPSVAACLSWAMATDAVGVWGNTSDAERASMKRRTARQRAKGGGE